MKNANFKTIKFLMTHENEFLSKKVRGFKGFTYFKMKLT